MTGCHEPEHDPVEHLCLDVERGARCAARSFQRGDTELVVTGRNVAVPERGTRDPEPGSVSCAVHCCSGAAYCGIPGGASGQRCWMAAVRSPSEAGVVNDFARDIACAVELAWRVGGAASQGCYDEDDDEQRAQRRFQFGTCDGGRPWQVAL